MATETSIPLSKRGQCSSCRQPMWKSSTSAQTQTCHPCRRNMHGAAGYARGCRCSNCRSGIAASQREYGRKLKTEGRKRKRPTVPATCAHCGTEFLARKDNVAKGGGLHCSISCANYTKAKQRGFSTPPKPKSAFRKRAERLAQKAAEGTTGGNLLWVQGACILCGTQFTSPGAASRYCSKACRTKNRQRTFGLTWLDRMAIFAADNWQCQICREPVDYTADPLSDWYPSLDHIVPRSHGGSDDISNLRTAHRWCNSVRGDLSHYTDADLYSCPQGVS